MDERYCRSLLLPHHRLPPPPLLPLEAWNMMPQHRENLSFTRPALFWSECEIQRHQLTFIKDRATNACFIILLESFESKEVNPHQNCETSQFQEQPYETQEPESKNPIACHPGLAYFFQSVLTVPSIAPTSVVLFGSVSFAVEAHCTQKQSSCDKATVEKTRHVGKDKARKFQK